MWPYYQIIIFRDIIMEFTERLPIKPIQWLSQLSLKEFSQICPTDSKQDCKNYFSLLQHFCKKKEQPDRSDTILPD